MTNGESGNGHVGVLLRPLVIVSLPLWLWLSEEEMDERRILVVAVGKCREESVGDVGYRK